MTARFRSRSAILRWSERNRLQGYWKICRENDIILPALPYQNRQKGKAMIVHGNRNHVIGERNFLIYGQFIEHFHRQIYGGIYDPSSEFADADGFRTDVLEAMRRIRVPILRWPGGCFVSSYDWEKGVGKERIPVFDKAWRVEEPNTFGTDEYIRLCRKVGCEPYICTNAGTGTAEEMSNWLEYCNLNHEGQYARRRIANGHTDPYHVRYWSIGNENYGFWEIGAKERQEWGSLVREAAKMMKHVDPDIELTAAALADLDWTLQLLKSAAPFLDWISLHGYWDEIHETNAAAEYEPCMVYTESVSDQVDKVRGLLTALGLQKKIRIAFDEWNLRQWYHPGVHNLVQSDDPSYYIGERDRNDDNSLYTMADAVFSACFLNMCLRNCDLVGMAGFAPTVNTRGCIYTYDKGIVCRSTYYVFDLYVHYLGDIVLNTWEEQMPVRSLRSVDGEAQDVHMVDAVVTAFHDSGKLAAALVNKEKNSPCEIELELEGECGDAVLHYIEGESAEDYNDIGRNHIGIREKKLGRFENRMRITLPAHSVCVLSIGQESGSPLFP